MTFTESLEKYEQHLTNLERSPKTIKGYIQELEFFYRWLSEKHNGPIKPSDLGADDINEFLLWLKEERDYKPSSRRRVAAALKIYLA